jgi:hypothetical protein
MHECAGSSPCFCFKEGAIILNKRRWNVGPPVFVFETDVIGDSVALLLQNVRRCSSKWRWGKKLVIEGRTVKRGAAGKSSAMGRLLDGLARRFVGGVDLEVLDGLQGSAVRTIVELVQTREAEKQAFELVELLEKYPVWHRGPHDRFPN